MPAEMPKAYEPKDVEPHWYAYWLEHRVFEASGDPADDRPTYCVPMPPPNVTGALHMGHALTVTIEDILTRWHRMRGFNTLWTPGLDHAGIATQLVVERNLRREGIERRSLGREAFVERVWKWKAESGGRIAQQQRELGASPDWSRSKFTMDEDMSRSVARAFVQLYEEGLMYRATRLINWCVECHTALSDLEVDNEEGHNGELFEFAYELEGKEGELVVATTRPETMLGDSAVAIHSSDPRYLAVHGKRVMHPFLAGRTLPIIVDDVLVDPKFGTGAVKVTPAHDFNDFATGKRHQLEELTIFTLDGKMNDAAGEFRGMDRREARKAVKRRLEELGLVRGSKPHLMTLPRCDRCASVVEPMISTQWFVRMKPLADPALEAVAQGRIEIVPAEWTKTYNHFLSNIQDWCVSRQLWWGHRIPAWTCNNGHLTVQTEAPAVCGTCRSAELTQDEDVLDTWFSSGLWPFSTLGWPEQTEALRKFYPASDLETGYDILFFWVARMIMMGLHFMGDVPFRRVLLHGLVVDENGDKMSKVKGNVLDPLDLIHGAAFEDVVQKALPGAPVAEALSKFRKSYPSVAQMGQGFPAFGADALRFTLASHSPQAKRIALAPKRLEGYRNFCNKIWNATRFAMPYIEDVVVPAEPPLASSRANRWILSRLSHTMEAVHQGLSEFRLDDASGALYRFFWNELCDWYLELVKPILQGDETPAREEVRTTLVYVLETSLRALHPIIPFLTEELWHRLQRPVSAPSSIALATYPTAQCAARDVGTERDMSVLQAVISAARTVRSEHEVHPGAQVELTLRSKSPELLELFREETLALRTLVKTNGFPRVEPSGGARPKGTVLNVTSNVEIMVSLRGLVDAAKETARIEREIKKTQKDIGVMEKKLSSSSFLEKAPASVVEEAQKQLVDLRHKVAQLEEGRELVQELE